MTRLLLPLILCATAPAQLLYPAGQWMPPSFATPPAQAVYLGGMDCFCPLPADGQASAPWTGLVPLTWSLQESFDAQVPWWPDPRVWANTTAFVFAGQPLTLMARLDVGGPATWVQAPTGRIVAMPGGFAPGIYGLPPIGAYVQVAILVQHWAASPSAPWLNWSVGPVTVWIP